MLAVKSFDLNRKDRKRSSLIKDGIEYAKVDFDMDLILSQNNFEVKYKKNNEVIITNNKIEIAKGLREHNMSRLENEILKSTWQGNIFRIRLEDDELVKNSSYNWLTRWKESPVDIINDLQSIHLQTIPTLAFTAHRLVNMPISTTCRLCHKGVETVKHLLSNCGSFVNVDYIRRHNRTLQCILLPLLQANNFIENSPPWYTPMIIKPRYENENVIILRDIPEYVGSEEEDEMKTYRPDGKIIFKNDRIIILLEMNVPWIENRELKLAEKVEKYKGIIRNLKLEYPNFKIEQATLIMDALGGFSENLKTNIKKIGYNNNTIEKLLMRMQKIVLWEARYIINKFKISTSE